MASALAAHWTLDQRVTFLNHGSFGACPAAVQAVQGEWRALMEAEPVAFLGERLEGRIDTALGALAGFLAAGANDLAFVPNATTGVNAVVRSLRIEPGAELLTTDHAYTACRNALDFVARRAGASVVVARVPFVGASPDAVLGAVLDAVTPRTRLAMIDHVTSPTGMTFPIKGLIDTLHPLGVDVLVDGAHAPGMLPVALSDLGAAYYTGNCHKWMCAPKGAGFLWARPDRQDHLVPTTVSHGASSPRTDRSRFQLNFGWTGTIDPTSYLSVPAAIETISGLSPEGWPGVMRANHEMALLGRSILCDALAVEAPVPDEMIGSLASIPLPVAVSGEEVAGVAADLHDRLRDDFAIQVPVFAWSGSVHPIVRISAQLYNSADDYVHLAAALVALIRGGPGPSGYDSAMTDSPPGEEHPDARSGDDRRSGSDRRAGTDRRSATDRRRQGIDRRSGSERRDIEQSVEEERRSGSDRRRGRRRSGSRRRGTDRRSRRDRRTGD